jgi:heme a synthase
VTSTVTARGPWLHRYAAFVALCTLFLIFAGGLVTSTGSGLAVPDWPLSFGQLFPRMEGGVFYEHGHRMIAATVGALTVVLAIWLWRADDRPWLRRLGLVAVAAVIVQGVLGGLTVLLRLPDATSIAHAGLAQLFFCLTVTIAVALAPGWRDLDRSVGPSVRRSVDAATLKLAIAALAAVYVQILIGAFVRHIGAALIFPTFPLAEGRLWPAIDNRFEAWQMAHRLGAVVVVLVAGLAVARVLALYRDVAWLRNAAVAVLAALAWQFFLGALTIWTQRAVTPTTLHVASGALLLAVCLVMVLRLARLSGPSVRRSVGPSPLPS